MTQAAKKQRQVIARVGQNGELHILGEVMPFVSSRLGAESVSRETNSEHDYECTVVEDAARWRDRSAL